VRLLEIDDQGVFNLVAGREAPFANEVVELACDRFDVPRPQVVAGGGPEDDDHGAVYMPYFDMEIVFDDTRARAALNGLRAPRLPEFFDTLMDYAEETRWGKRAMTREEARERVSREPAAV
jgi:nucleoside-diphosphate-sugar epimerase